MIEEIDDPEKPLTIEEYESKDVTKWITYGTLAVFGLALLAFIIGVVLTFAFNNMPFPYRALNVRADHTNVWIHEIFTDSGVWEVPKVIDSDFQTELYMSGGGGGGCTSSNSFAGGGGNSGVSVVKFPVLIHKKDICSITIGNGGIQNENGGDTSFRCTSKSTGQTTVSISVSGGRSGCTPLGIPLGSTLSYPYVAEAFGARPINGTLAQGIIFGGIGGLGESGGAGSIFGNGAKSYDIDATNYGSGGSGSVANGLNAGKGANGAVKLLWPMKIKSNL